MIAAIRRLERALVRDFFRVHSSRNDADWCFCTAWWVDSWQGWSQRTAGENRELRTGLFGRGVYDGYLLYLGDEPVGWCQVGQRDRLAKLVTQFDLASDPTAWAISCLLIAPDQRRKGLSKKFLELVLIDLSASGVKRVEAYPKRGPELEAAELWNGPLAIFTEAGFTPVRRYRDRVLLVKELSSP